MASSYIALLFFPCFVAFVSIGSAGHVPRQGPCFRPAGLYAELTNTVYEHQVVRSAHPLSPMTEQTEWCLSADQRKSTVSRVAANIATIAFSQGQQISGADADRAAENAERKAYTVARVEAQTTTGVRPHSETYEAYTR